MGGRSSRRRYTRSPSAAGAAAAPHHPTRDVDLDDALLFVARITIDEDGDVVGARLIRGADRARAEAAAASIWRFRYAPALDDAGHPQRVTIDQPFALGP